MAAKPTYKELDKGIKELERIFNFSIDMIGSGNLDGYFTKINSSFGKILGYTEEEFFKKPFISFVHDEDAEKTKEALADAIDGKKELYIENRYKCKDGLYKWIEWKVLSIAQENKFYAVGREITERKWAEEALNNANERLEEKVKIRTNELERMNKALKVLLDQRKNDKKQMEKVIILNIKKLIKPNLARLKKSSLSGRQKSELAILEANLNEIISPFESSLSSEYLKLTPTEMQVANFIKHNATSREIASSLGLSRRTVDTHRYNIRKKVGIRRKGVNLRTYLSSQA